MSVTKDVEKNLAKYVFSVKANGNKIAKNSGVVYIEMHSKQSFVYCIIAVLEFIFLNNKAFMSV